MWAATGGHHHHRSSRSCPHPFPGTHLYGSRRAFNFRFSHARLIVENTFGILTSQWRMYRGVIGVSPSNVDACVKVTCILHNFIRKTTRPTTRPQPRPGQSAGPSANREAAGLQRIHRAGSNNATREALLVREAYVSYFSNEGAVGWQPEHSFKTALLRATQIQ